MKRYLLDTGIAGLYIDRKRGVYERAREELAKGNRVGIGAPVLAELAYRAEGSPNRDRNIRRLHLAIASWKLWLVTESVAFAYGQIAIELRRLGRPIGQNDMMIAAICRTIGNCTVVTMDSDLRAVPGLAVENWAPPFFLMVFLHSLPSGTMAVFAAGRLDRQNGCLPFQPLQDNARKEAMITHLPGMQLPTESALDITIHVTQPLNITSFSARQKVTQYVMHELSTQLGGETPELTVGERVYWSVPVVFSLPGKGVLRRVGTLRVDAATGELLTDPKTEQEMMHHAEQLAQRATL